MPAKLECPICLCSIKNKKTDFIATSCGHCFHASCLMRHLSMNGFSCPYCRNIMTEESQEEEKEEEEEIVVRKTKIEGKKYLIDKHNNLYDYEAYIRDGNQEVVGLWDPVHRVVVTN